MLRDWFQSEYYETSAKTGDNVTDVFTRIGQIILNINLSEKSQPMM
jgi:hypothetical protein